MLLQHGLHGMRTDAEVARHQCRHPRRPAKPGVTLLAGEAKDECARPGAVEGEIAALRAYLRQREWLLDYAASTYAHRM